MVVSEQRSARGFESRARSGRHPAEIVQRIPDRAGRPSEAVRYKINRVNGDPTRADSFPRISGFLTDEKKRDIYRRFLQGIDVETLASEFNRTLTCVRRVVAEVRADVIQTQPIDFVDAPEFHMARADDLILGPPPVSDRKVSLAKAPSGVSPYLASLYSIPLLNREEEIYHFRKMNYLKFKASELRKSLDLARPRMRDMDDVASLMQQAEDVRTLLIRSNLRLVVSIATKYSKPSVNFFDLVSDGNLTLIRAIEKYDFTRGFKFSTYASLAIMRNFARSIPNERVQLDRYRTGHDEVFDRSSESRSASLTEERVNQHRHQALMGMISQLPERERDIIVSRYGLCDATAPQTLAEVGLRWGVTRERIRQLETRAMNTLRTIIETNHTELSEFPELIE